MKLQSRKDKTQKIVLIVVLAVVLLAIVVGLIIGLVSNTSDSDNPNNPNSSTHNPSEITGINIATKPKLVYYVGEAFDPSGILVQIVTRDPNQTHFVDETDKDLTFSGFDSSEANESVTVYVSYKEHTTAYSVQIKERESSNGSNSSSTNANVVKVEVCDMFTTYTKDEWNNLGPSDLNAYVKLTYADGTVRGSLEETPITRADMYGYEKVNAPGTTYITVKYVEKGHTYEVTVPITITN